MNDWKFRIFKPEEFERPARPVRRVFLHCTASDLEHLKGVKLAEEVNRWHIEKEGWAGVGYHFLIDKAGTIVAGRPLELTPAAQLGKDGRGNIGTIAICTHGVWSFTAESLEATKALCSAIAAAYADRGGTVSFHGHREIDPRPCPVYGYQGLLGLNAAGMMGTMTYLPPAIVAAACRNLELPATPPPARPRMMHLGDQGEDVRSLRTFLQVGDGEDFDVATDAAVRVVQAAHALVVDGVVGPNTRAVLGL